MIYDTIHQVRVDIKVNEIYQLNYSDCNKVHTYLIRRSSVNCKLNWTSSRDVYFLVTLHPKTEMFEEDQNV